MEPNLQPSPQQPQPNNPQQPTPSNPSPVSGGQSSNNVTPSFSPDSTPRSFPPTNAQVPPANPVPVATPVVTPENAGSAQPQPVFFSSDPSPVPGLSPAGSKPKGKKLALIFTGALAGIFLIGGAVAAAYFGVVVPNKPENVLRQALINTSKEKEVSLNGTLNMAPVDPNKGGMVPAMKATYEAKTNIDEKQTEMTLKLTVSGIDFPVDTRYIDDTLYVKVGDLSTIAALASGYGSSFGLDPATVDPLIKNVSNLISNQWIEFDSTLLDTGGINCIADISPTLTDQDITVLEDAYTKNSFATIDSHSNDTIDGKSAIKYRISVDDNKLAKFMEDKKLEELSFIKAANKCPGDKGDTSIDTEELADDDITPLTVWVDKDTKRITKIASETTKQDAEKENLKGSVEATIQYGNVTVTKPENAKPAMQLWGELQQELTPLFSGFASPDFYTDDISIDPAFDDYVLQ